MRILNSTSIGAITLFGILFLSLSLMFPPISSADDLKAAADVDRDGNINIRDLTLVGKHFGETIDPNQGVPNPDVDRDGNVNIRDLTLVAKYFGQTVEHPSVPFDGLITVTDATFNNLVLNSELPVVVEFGADW